MGTRKREALLVFSVNRYQLFVRGMTTEEEAKAGSYLLKKNYSPEMGDLKTSDNKSVDLRPVLCCSPMGDVLFLSRARTRAERFDRMMFMRTRRAVPRGAPRKNHTSGTRHLAQSTRDVGASGRCESVRGARYKYEPCQTRPPRG